ncbi:MAG: metal dependent hydrolase [Herbinix sp.]|jgi:glyoxylase-like metal-dependent hydrolase (beta-lactamase superfamily II)|nr:metal dependent hydrolase [Herbinix sp.]
MNDNIIMLKIPYDFGYGEEIIYPVILKDDHELILVDCGYADFLPKLELAVKEKGIDLMALTKVIITHHDHDHMGSLAAIRKKYPNVQVIASEEEAPYIEGKVKSLRLEQAEQIQLQLSPEQQEEGRAFQEILRAVENVEVTLTVKDGDCIDCCGGIEIVETPGHMPGHISIYVRESKVFISGDALVIENGKLEIAAPQYTLDLIEAKRSISKLRDYDIQKIICYHGGDYSGDIAKVLMEHSPHFSE